jgi:hypothetical protein
MGLAKVCFISNRILDLKGALKTRPEVAEVSFLSVMPSYLLRDN